MFPFWEVPGDRDMYSDVLLLAWLGVYVVFVSVCFLFAVLVVLGIAEFCFSCVVCC
jgi:hypothetical protein